MLFSEILANIRSNMSISHIYVFQMMVNIIKCRINDTYFMPVLAKIKYNKKITKIIKQKDKVIVIK